MRRSFLAVFAPLAVVQHEVARQSASQMAGRMDRVDCDAGARAANLGPLSDGAGPDSAQLVQGEAVQAVSLVHDETEGRLGKGPFGPRFFEAPVPLRPKQPLALAQRPLDEGHVGGTFDQPLESGHTAGPVHTHLDVGLSLAIFLGRVL